MSFELRRKASPGGLTEHAIIIYHRASNPSPPSRRPSPARNKPPKPTNRPPTPAKPTTGHPRLPLPAAQDFATFGYGESSKAINMEDADGIALAAIQGLYELFKEQESQIAAQAAEITALKKQIEEITSLRIRLAKTEAAIGKLINSNEGGQL